MEITPEGYATPFRSKRHPSKMVCQDKGCHNRNRPTAISGELHSDYYTTWAESMAVRACGHICEIIISSDAGLEHGLVFADHWARSFCCLCRFERFYKKKMPVTEFNLCHICRERKKREESS